MNFVFGCDDFEGFFVDCIIELNLMMFVVVVYSLIVEVACDFIWHVVCQCMGYGFYVGQTTKLVVDFVGIFLIYHDSDVMDD